MENMKRKVWILVQQLLPKRNSQSWEPNRKALAYKPWNMSVRPRGRCRLADNSAFYPSRVIPGESTVTTLTQKRAVFPAFSSREVTSGQIRKIGIHFIIYHFLSDSESGSPVESFFTSHS